MTQDIALEVDGQRPPLVLKEVQFPSLQEMTEGVGAIHLDLTAEIGLNAANAHHLSFRNDHLPEIGTYLANALIRKTGAIEINEQQRDSLQHEFQLDFRVLTADAPIEFRQVSWWASVLLLIICSVLLLWQWKHLFFRRIYEIN